MLASSDPRLAANKRLVYNFWREVFEAGHMDLAEKYMAEGYIQHNPNVPTGRAAFVDFFSRNVALQPIESRIQAPLVTILPKVTSWFSPLCAKASIRRTQARKYSTTWFDMFRIENGKIAEHLGPRDEEVATRAARRAAGLDPVRGRATSPDTRASVTHRPRL